MSGFLCTMVGASFTVAAAAEVIRLKKSVIANGNAQIDTAQSKFGGSSALFDGTGDYLNCDSGFSFTGDFTIEFFVRFAAVGASSRGLATDRPPTSAGYTSTNWYIEKNTSDGLYAGISGYGDIISANNLVTTGVWYHIAFVRSGTSVRLYLDGTERGTALTYGGTVGDGDISFGAIVGLYLNGHMDEIRVSKSARYTANFTPSTTPFVNDDNTVLLIHADGTDGSTFFEDDNGVRASIRLTGLNSAALSTAQSKFGGSSLIGSTSTNQQIEIDNKALNDISGPFTIECWFRTTNLTMSNNLLFFSNQGGAGRRGIHITNQTIRYSISGTDVITTGNFITSGTWHHIALVRNSSNTTNLYIDGTSRGSYANDTLSVNAGNSTRIFGLAGVFTPDGHLDEFRISKVARYTSNFTAPTAPFVNDADTTLLVHFDGTNGQTVFRDDNGLIPFSTRTAKTLTAYGNAQVDTAQYKYGSSALLCDGNGDYVLASDNADFAFGTSSFTIEYWIRFNAINTLYVPICSRAGTGVGVGDWWCEITAAENKMYWGFRNQAGTTYYVNLALAGTAFATGQWYHIALVNNAGTAQMYVNGTATGTTTALSGSFGGGSGGTQGVAVGALGQGSYSVNGWIDEVLISKTARYTANFTPTGPYNSDSNTVLLMHMEGTDASTTFTDDVFGVRTQKGIQAVGNAQIDTAQSKFGGASALFDGTDDRLEINPTTTYDDFTVECWIRLANNSGTKNILSFGNESTGRVFFAVYNDRIYWDQYGVTSRYGNTSMSANVWYHLAWSRTGSTIKLFVDGVEQTMTTVSGSGVFPSGAVGNTNGIFVGTLSDGAIDFNGHIDEIRVSNSVRYTTGFTAPTAPFQNDANTVLLLHMDGTDASTVFFDDNGRDTTPTA